MENSNKKVIKLFFRSKRNPMAKELRTSPKWKQRVVKDKKKYDRKNGNKFLEECKEVVGKCGGEVSNIKD